MENLNHMLEAAAIGCPTGMVPTAMPKEFVEYVKTGYTICCATSLLEPIINAAGPGVDGGAARAGYLMASSGAVVITVEAAGTTPSLLDLASRLIITSSAGQHPVILMVTDRRDVVAFANPGTVLPSIASKVEVISESMLVPLQVDLALSLLSWAQDCRGGIVIGHRVGEVYVHGADAHTAALIAGAGQVLHHYESEPIPKVTTYHLGHEGAMPLEPIPLMVSAAADPTALAQDLAGLLALPTPVPSLGEFLHDRGWVDALGTFDAQLARMRPSLFARLVGEVGTTYGPGAVQRVIELSSAAEAEEFEKERRKSACRDDARHFEGRRGKGPGRPRGKNHRRQRSDLSAFD